MRYNEPSVLCCKWVKNLTIGVHVLQIGSLAKEYGLKLHMDGARVFNASVASGVPVSRIVQDFDSVSICFSKGLSAPVGCVIVGNSAFIEK